MACKPIHYLQPLQSHGLVDIPYVTELDLIFIALSQIRFNLDRLQNIDSIWWLLFCLVHTYCTIILTLY